MRALRQFEQGRYGGILYLPPIGEVLKANRPVPHFLLNRRDTFKVWQLVVVRALVVHIDVACLQHVDGRALAPFQSEIFAVRGVAEDSLLGDPAPISIELVDRGLLQFCVSVFDCDPGGLQARGQVLVEQHGVSKFAGNVVVGELGEDLDLQLFLPSEEGENGHLSRD